MIIVDTNILSEFTRIAPSDAVVSWFAAQNADELWTTAVTEAEMLVGLAQLPSGRRKNELALAIEKVLGIFGHRILPFDRDAAQQLPAIVIERRSAQLQTKEADGLIAAITRAHRATLATRNTADFEHCGISIVNPWTL